MFTQIDTHKHLFMQEMQVQGISGLRIVIAAGDVAEDAPADNSYKKQCSL